jgi:hypothetical protein
MAVLGFSACTSNMMDCFQVLLSSTTCGATPGEQLQAYGWDNVLAWLLFKRSAAAEPESTKTARLTTAGSSARFTAGGTAVTVRRCKLPR